MNYNQSKHLIDLKRSGGLVSGVKNLNYINVYTREELEQTFLTRLKDLNYPLRVEPKRDRFVMNSKALQEALEQATEIALDNIQEDISKWVNTEVKEEIVESTEQVIGYFLNSKTPNTTGTKFAKSLGAMFGKVLAKDIISIFNDITQGKHPKKKKKHH